MNKISSSLVPIFLDDIDTDQIIPARFLKSTEREGFGENLFRDWRFDKTGHKISEFGLNNPKWKGEILVVGKNFGCGSSREHAAWAIKDYGFNAIISTYFADIFKGNCLNNGLLPVEVSESFHQEMKKELSIDPQTKIDIDIEQQEVVLRVTGIKERFEISEYKKKCILNGLDDLDYLIQMKEAINEHQKK